MWMDNFRDARNTQNVYENTRSHLSSCFIKRIVWKACALQWWDGGEITKFHLPIHRQRRPSAASKLNFNLTHHRQPCPLTLPFLLSSLTAAEHIPICKRKKKKELPSLCRSRPKRFCPPPSPLQSQVRVSLFSRSTAYRSRLSRFDW